MPARERIWHTLSRDVEAAGACSRSSGRSSSAPSTTTCSRSSCRCSRCTSWRPRARAASCRSSARSSSCRSCCFPGYAGQLADIYSKRTVLVVSKSLEIVAAALGLIGVRLRPPAAHLRGAVPDRAAGDVLQPGEIRHPARDAARSRSVARKRRARDEHVRRDRARHGGRRLPVRALARASLDRSACSSSAWRSSAPRRASGSRRCPPAAPGQRIQRNPWGEIWTGIATLRRDRVLWLTVARHLVLLVPRIAAAARGDPVRQPR